MIFQLGVLLCSFHNHRYWNKSTAETSTWAEGSVSKTTETKCKHHSKPASGNNKEFYKTDAWKEPSLSVSVADTIDVQIPGPTTKVTGSFSNGPHKSLSALSFPLPQEQAGPVQHQPRCWLVDTFRNILKQRGKMLVKTPQVPCPLVGLFWSMPCEDFKGSEVGLGPCWPQW